MANEINNDIVMVLESSQEFYRDRIQEGAYASQDSLNEQLAGDLEANFFIKRLDKGLDPKEYILNDEDLKVQNDRLVNMNCQLREALEKAQQQLMRNSAAFGELSQKYQELKKTLHTKGKDEE